jgi:hypothetical protein
MTRTQVILTDKDGNSRRYDSITSAAITMNLSASTVRKYLDTGKPLPGFGNRRITISRA